MLILGIHAGMNRFEEEDDYESFALHDSAAVLIRDGEVVTGIEEERLDRIKHSNCFPVRAIQFCLECSKCSLEDVDLIAINLSEARAEIAAKLTMIENSRDRTPPDAKSRIAAQFERAFGLNIRGKLFFCNHHIAHAWSAFAFAGFDRSLILTLDGDGDDSSGMVLVCDGRELTVLRDFSISQSLGDVYQNLIKILGYHRFDEYKAMGLAPYGNPERFRSLFETCYKLLPDGNYSLEPLNTWFKCFDLAGLIVQARRSGAPFLQIHKDFAAALQEMLERIALHVLQYFSKTTNEKCLCLAGGVAHNCTMNGRILYSRLFEKVFVQPAAHDAGGALGAAMCAWYSKHTQAKPKRLAHIYWGSDTGSDDAVEEMLRPWSQFISYTREDLISAKAAKLLADGAVVGWIQGRSEFGPRALGNRSILADPRYPENKLRINSMVKKREEFRPFAPSVLEEKMSEYFAVTADQTEFPFMVFVLEVREEVRNVLGAVTHVDGTARVQSVSRATNPRYWDLINEFAKLTGIPIILNTSFNNDAEPIVDSVDDAITCFLTTGINFLAVGNCLVSKRSSQEIRDAAVSLLPRLLPSKKLVKRVKTNWAAGTADVSFGVESTRSRYFGAAITPISSDMFSILQGANGLHDFGSLLKRNGIPVQNSPGLIEELMELWSRRVVSCISESAIPVASDCRRPAAHASALLGSKV